MQNLFHIPDSSMDLMLDRVGALNAQAHEDGRPAVALGVVGYEDIRMGHGKVERRYQVRLQETRSSDMAQCAEILSALGTTVAESCLLDAEMYLTYVAWGIRTRGWISAKDSEQTGAESSSSYGLRAMRGQLAADPSTQDRALAADALRWARETLAQREYISNYHHHLVMISAEDVVEEQYVSLAASLVAAYQQDLEKQRLANECPSQHVGSLGERREVSGLQVLVAAHLDTRYGTAWLHLLEDGAGNRYSWITSTRELWIGQRYAGRVNYPPLKRWACNTAQVKDRPTRAHEYIFLLSKSPHYFYDHKAVKEPVAESTIKRGVVEYGGVKGCNYHPDAADPNFRNGSDQWGRTYDHQQCSDTGRNLRTIWWLPSA
jgi:hypothetical protein